MSGFIGTAWIEVKPQLDKFSKDIQSKMSSLQAGMSSWGKKLSVGLTLPIIGFFKTAVDEAEEAAKVGRLTEAALKSTGNAAVLSAKKVGKLSTTVGELVGQDNDAVQATANLVLNMVDLTKFGKNADDVLTAITETSYNYAVATGKSETSAVKLFTTLANDPAKAISRLKALGVINDKQSKQYAELVKKGDGLRVSQELLAIAQKKWKDQAYKSLTPTEKLAVKFADMKEQLGKFLLPVVKKITDKLGELIDKFTKLPKETKKKIVELAAVLAALGPSLLILSKVATVLGSVWKVLGFGIGVLTWLTYALQLFLATVFGVGVSTAVAFGIVLVVIAAVALAAWWIIKNWDKVKEWFSSFVNWLSENWKKLLASITGLVGVAVAWVIEHWDAVKAWFKNLPATISNAFQSIKDAIVGAFKSAINFVIGMWNKLDFRIDFTLPDVKFVPGLDGQRISTPDLIPDIPLLAKGGIVRQPTLAMVGEAGPEAVIPLSQLNAVLGSGRLEIVDWRRGIATLSRELDHSTFVRGE